MHFLDGERGVKLGRGLGGGGGGGGGWDLS